MRHGVRAPPSIAAISPALLQSRVAGPPSPPVPPPPCGHRHDWLQTLHAATRTEFLDAAASTAPAHASAAATAAARVTTASALRFPSTTVYRKLLGKLQKNKPSHGKVSLLGTLVQYGASL